MFDVVQTTEPKPAPNEETLQSEQAETPKSEDIPAEAPFAVNSPITNLPRQVESPNDHDANTTMPKRDVSTFNN